jgi:hypothetical protein
MATKKSGAPRKPIDTSGITMLEKVVVPKSTRGSKYPWAQLIGKPDGGFFVPMENEAVAKTASASIRTSGNTFYKNRELPRRAVAFAGQQNGKWGVVCATVSTIEEDGKKE